MKEDLENNRWTPAKHPRAKEDPTLMTASKSLEGSLAYPSSNWTRSNRELRRSSEQANSEVDTWGAAGDHLGSQNVTPRTPSSGVSGHRGGTWTCSTNWKSISTYRPRSLDRAVPRRKPGVLVQSCAVIKIHQQKAASGAKV